MVPDRRLIRLVLLGLAAGVLVVTSVGCAPPTQPPPEGPDLPDDTDDGGEEDQSAPEIRVWQDGYAVYPSEEVSYGIVCVNLCRTKTFQITNEGDADLILTGEADKLVLSGPDSALFHVVLQPSSPIAPQGTTYLSIRFDAESEGTKRATVSIGTNDPAWASFDFTLTADGLVPPAKVSATGQTTVYATGDDGDLQMGVAWPDPRFTDNEDGTTTDSLTGLMWLTSPPSSSAVTWNSAINTANGLTTAAYEDWHVPNVNEFMSLLNAAAPDIATALNGTGLFNGIVSSRYWTSTRSYSSGNDYAWVTWMDDGMLTRLGPPWSATTYHWAVRSVGGGVGAVELPRTGKTASYLTGDDGDLRLGAAWPSPRFTDNGDGTIADSLTGLVWEQTPLSTSWSWSGALTYANELTLGEHDDWRLPNVNELRSLINYGASNVADWLMGNRFHNVDDYVYWSSTTFAPDTDHAWYVVFQFGHTQAFAKSAGARAWAVRGGE